jgi:hypothetical protein
LHLSSPWRGKASSCPRRAVPLRCPRQGAWAIVGGTTPGVVTPGPAPLRRFHRPPRRGNGILEPPTALVISRVTRPRDPGPFGDAAAPAIGPDSHAARRNTVVPKPPESMVGPNAATRSSRRQTAQCTAHQPRHPTPVTRDQFAMRPHQQMEPTRTPPERTLWSLSLLDPWSGPTRQRDPRAAEPPTALVISRVTQPRDPGPVRDAAASGNGTDPHAAPLNTRVPKPPESMVGPDVAS